MSMQIGKVVSGLVFLLNAVYHPLVYAIDETGDKHAGSQERAMIAELDRLEEQKRALEHRQHQIKRQLQAMGAPQSQPNNADGAQTPVSLAKAGNGTLGRPGYVIMTFLAAIGLGFLWRKFSSGPPVDERRDMTKSRPASIDNLQKQPVDLSSAPVPAPTDILVVEDNVVNQKLLVRMIEKMGYRADIAGNGREAVAALADKPYAIVLMDCQMPEMHGFEATAQIRQHDAQAGIHTTIIAVTAQTTPGAREDCLSVGMDEYLAKPIKPQTLRDILGRFAPPLPVSGQEKPKPQSEQAPISLPPPCNISEALVHIDGDTEMLQEMAEIFLSECPRLLEQIQTAIDSRDAEDLVSSARTLKVSISNFVAAEAFEAAVALEQIGLQGKLDHAPQAVVRLEEALGRLRPALSDLKEMAA